MSRVVYLWVRSYVMLGQRSTSNLGKRTGLSQVQEVLLLKGDGRESD